MHRNLIWCLLLHIRVRVQRHPHLVQQLLAGAIGFELEVVEARCGNLLLVGLGKWLGDEKLGKGGKDAHHDGEHVTQNQFLAFIGVADVPKSLNREEKEAIRCVEGARDLW